MTLEIIVFVLAILFGIIWYWRESTNNRLYRWLNAITHAKNLRMKSENQKGFVHLRPFLIRLVWISLFFLILGLAISFLTPVNAFYIQYFASAIVGTLIGTYLASWVIFAQKNTSGEKMEEWVERGKELIEDLQQEKEMEAPSEPIKKEETEPKGKSARDRLKDKGMIK